MRRSMGLAAIRCHGWVCGALTAGVALFFLTAGPAAAAPPKLEGKPAATPPTFSKDVAPLLRQHCQACHRKGEVAPFPLETYVQARKRAEDLVSVTSDRSMPPWKPEPGVGPPLEHDRSLSAAEIATIQAWAAAGAPEGDAKDLPPPSTFEEGWALGTPDLVLEMPEEFVVPPSGPDIYRCFVIPTTVPDDTYVSAVDFRPGNHRVVHHMLTYLDTSGEARARDAADPGPGYESLAGPGIEVAGDLGGWTSGNKPTHLPDGVARPFPRGADLVLQIHYHPSGRPEKDRTKLGLHFTKMPVRQSFHWANASNYKFQIAAGQSDVEVKASWFVPVDMQALAVNPHMHLLGHDIRMSVTYPGGKSRDLIHVKDWDPAWQDAYYFKTPVELPKGSTVKVVARYDNTAHARNPNTPPKTVKVGPKATDEMCVGYVGVVKKDQDLTRMGEKDDLFEVLLRQHERGRLRAQDAQNRRRADRR